MNIRLIAIGKTDQPYLQEGIDDYTARLRHYCRFQFLIIPSLKDASSLPPDQIKEREGRLLLPYIREADLTILLDEHGRELTSVGFSQLLQQQLNASVRTLNFIIGGAYGFSPAVYAAAPQRLSLSQMTFNHQMVRLFFLEQLYRAHTLLHHEKYHNA